MSPMNSTLPRLLAVTALVGGLAVASPVLAASGDAGSAMTPSSSTSATTTKHHHHMHKSMTGEDVETRIKTLHDRLKISPDQEEAWTTVAQTMRDNETSFKALVDERHADAATKTAVEDLESYQKIAQAHADGFSKVVDAFKPLYDSMSDDQKKNADEVFGRFEGHRGSPEAMKMAPKVNK